MSLEYLIEDRRRVERQVAVGAAAVAPLPVICDEAVVIDQIELGEA